MTRALAHRAVFGGWLILVASAASSSAAASRLDASMLAWSMLTTTCSPSGRSFPSGPGLSPLIWRME
jgi:hypothetical protein